MSSFRRVRTSPAGRILQRPACKSLSIAGPRARFAALTIARLTLTAVAAFVLARLITGARSPILAPLTALIVVQVTLYHSLRTALERVGSVVAGVILALGLSNALGFTWWSLGITVAAALAVGSALRLGASALEVPISAMWILSLPTEPAVTGRVVATLIGAATGLVSNFLVAPLRVQPAEEAVDDLGHRLAELLDQMAADLASGSGPDHTGHWVGQARNLTAELAQVEHSLGQAEESVRLNPRGVLVVDPRIYLRRRLDALEHATFTIRGIAQSLDESADIAGELNPVRDPSAAHGIADVLRELAAVLRAYARLARSKSVDRDAMKAEVDRHLAEATQRQRAVADTLRADPAVWSVGWPLRGELITELDRLRTELHPAPPRTGRLAIAAQTMSWHHPFRAMVLSWRRRRVGGRA